jgi:alcohol dehydrogenase
MKALYFDGQPRFEVDFPLPAPRSGEALIRVLLAGICSTDLEIFRGYSGFCGIPGHEFVGVVVEVNGPDQTLTGRRVVGEINIGCGACSLCRQGLASHCADRRVLGIRGHQGAFAEYLTLPVANLHPVPEKLAAEEAVFAEPLAAAFRILEQLHLRPSQKILVLGDGKLGLLAAQVLHLTGAAVTLLGHYPEKMAIAGRQGISTRSPRDLPADGSFEVVVEATGSAAGARQALCLIRPGGTLVLKSTLAAPTQLDPTEIVVKEIRVLGSRCGPFAPALRALAGGRLDTRSLITSVLPFARALEALALAGAKTSLKVLLDFRR